MNADGFRKLALALPGTEEKSHMGHPDFRVGDRIFATLNADGDRGVVMLNPEQQFNYVQADPAVFEPVCGAWGRRGSTTVHLKAAKTAIARRALGDAWRNRVERSASKRRTGGAQAG